MLQCTAVGFLNLILVTAVYKALARFLGFCNMMAPDRSGRGTGYAAIGDAKSGTSAKLPNYKPSAANVVSKR